MGEWSAMGAPRSVEAMDLSALFANAAIAFLLSVVVVVAIVIVSLWILYSVIWRAVRRGLAEHERSVADRPGARGYLGL